PQRPPPLRDVPSDGRDALPRSGAFHHLERLERGGGTDALGPEGAADERSLRLVHHVVSPNDRGDRVSIPERLSEDSDVWLHAVRVVQAAERLPESRRALVEHQNDAAGGGERADAFQEPCGWLLVPHHFHADHAHVWIGRRAFE